MYKAGFFYTEGGECSLHGTVSADSSDDHSSGLTIQRKDVGIFQSVQLSALNC